MFLTKRDPYWGISRNIAVGPWCMTEKKSLDTVLTFSNLPPPTTNPFSYWKWAPPPRHPLLWQIESQKCHIPSPWTFFCKQNHSPSIFSPSSSSSTPPSWEHNWLRIKLMFCRGHPVPPRLTAHVKPANPSPSHPHHPLCRYLTGKKLSPPTCRCQPRASRADCFSLLMSRGCLLAKGVPGQNPGSGVGGITQWQGWRFLAYMRKVWLEKERA